MQSLLPKSTGQSSKSRLKDEAAHEQDALNPRMVINMKSIDKEKDSLQEQTHEAGGGTTTHARVVKRDQQAAEEASNAP